MDQNSPILCGLCKASVEKLQTNSHVIPRWIMKFVKAGAPYLHITEEFTMNSQSDLKGDFVCEECERIFGRDDKFAEKILKYSSSLVSAIQSDNENLVFEEYIAELKEPFVRFIASVIIRSELYLISKGQQGSFGARFNELRRLYFKGEKISLLFPVLFERHAALRLVVREVLYSVNDGLESHEVFLLGWRCVMITGEKKSPEISRFIEKEKFLVLVYKNESPLVELLSDALFNGTRLDGKKSKQ